jgi:hypothetical protein
VIPLVPPASFAVVLVIGWLNEDEEPGATAAGADRLLRQQSAWPSRPGLRWPVR